MPVRLEGAPQRLQTLGGISSLAVQEEGARIEERHFVPAVVPVEDRFERRVIAGVEEKAGKRVADTLVVVWVEPEKPLIVADRLDGQPPADAGAGKRFDRAHEGAGPDVRPARRVRGEAPGR